METQTFYRDGDDSTKSLQKLCASTKSPQPEMTVFFVMSYENHKIKCKTSNSQYKWKRFYFSTIA